MAIQKLSSYDPIQSLTQSLTTGLSGGLQALAQHKTNQLKQRNLASALERLGLPQELSNISPQLQQAILPQVTKQALAPKTSGAQTGTQKEINKSTARFVDKFKEKASVADQIVKNSQEMLNLLRSGNVATGAGGLLPSFLQNEESQRFDALANEVAALKAKQTGGNPTNFKIKLMQLTKPNLLQKPGAQEKLLQKLLSEELETTRENQVLDDLLQEYEGNVPYNIESLIKKRARQLEASETEQENNDFSANDFQHPEQWQPGSQIEWEGKEYVQKNNKWVKV